ncbi:MAG TPA: SDR family NAD(P)-dependent oxidoreductase [Wenzhouxiangellaceae bacterium]|nr:SDR family NAD(P)-dependent oxidoreductase [Wenzhouxiangellaceae bacterium]
MGPQVAAIVGIGPGNGRALVERFHAEGYRVAMLTRSRDTLERYQQEFENAHGFECDAADAGSVATAFEAVREELGPVEVLVYNAGAGVWGGLGDVSADDFEATWRVNALGLFHCAGEVVGPMAEKGAGAIIVIGAGAAWRGRAGTIAFAQAKAAQRSTAQSLARQYGPEGIHVGYVVIDGVIDTPRTRERMPDKPDEFFLDAGDIALTVLSMVAQPRSAWTFETDLRPWQEDW